jgi:NAD-dependent dihydropyrimidine dehydrogenase PreA subunit
MPKPVIDYKKCTSCGTCVSVCPVSVFETQGNSNGISGAPKNSKNFSSEKGKKVVVAKPDDCIGCRACEAQCPSQAIKVED